MALDANSGTVPSVVSGTFTGTTAAQLLTLGFRPSWMLWYNQTDGDTVNFWHNSSTTNYVSMVLAAATVTATMTTTDHGINLAASDAVGNENTKVFVFIAGR